MPRRNAHAPLLCHRRSSGRHPLGQGDGRPRLPPRGPNRGGHPPVAPSPPRAHCRRRHRSGRLLCLYPGRRPAPGRFPGGGAWTGWTSRTPVSVPISASPSRTPVPAPASAAPSGTPVSVSARTAALSAAPSAPLLRRLPLPQAMRLAGHGRLQLATQAAGLPPVLDLSRSGATRPLAAALQTAISRITKGRSLAPAFLRRVPRARRGRRPSRPPQGTWRRS